MDTTPDGYVITARGWNDPLPCPCVGAYLQSYNPRADAYGGEQVFWWTRDINRAMIFQTIPEAVAKYREPLVDAAGLAITRPIDGQPERPLTAFDITIDPVFDEHEGEAMVSNVVSINSLNRKARP